MLQIQIIWLFIISIPVACISWTVTHEEIFHELHEYCVKRSQSSKNSFIRKAFYLFTCEYCFSHYVTIVFLLITKFTLLMPGWKGYLIGGFSVVWVANVYMTLFGLLRQAVKVEKTKILLEEKEISRFENIEIPKQNSD